MIVHRRIHFIVLSILMIFMVASCVSKNDYLIEVEEKKNLAEELRALRLAYADLKTKNETLNRQITDLTGDKTNLEQARAELQVRLVNFEQDNDRLKQETTDLEEISQANSETLAKQVTDLGVDISELEMENNRLMATLGGLQAKAQNLEIQRKEEILEMRGTYEHLMRDMKSEIEKGNITITQLKGKLKVNMLDEILFDSGRTTIKPQGLEVLERVGSIFLNIKDQSISIEGHTDNVPIGPELLNKYPTNWDLSVARASTVAKYLQEKIGIDPTLLSARGYGEYQPIASNAIEDGRARNRRIEIVLIPK